MGRPSKLSDQQRTEITRRLIEGAKAADLAREFKVSRALICGIQKRAQELKGVANQIVSAEQALGNLAVSEQLLAVSLASKLRNISQSIAGAAENGAATALRLSALANSEVQKVDDADPLASVDKLRNVGVLTKLANDSASIALNLLSANKDTVREINQPDDGTRTISWDEFYGRASQPQRGATGTVLEDAGPQ